MRPVAVFDIDGVLADVGHRLHHLESRPKRWAAFFAAAAADGLLDRGAALAGQMAVEHEIRYLTGRSERMRPVTEAWLLEFALPVGSLTMRPSNDRRPARVFKRECLTRWAAAGARIAIVVDDDPQVVSVIEALGIPVLLATWQHTPADEQQALWDAQEQTGRT